MNNRQPKRITYKDLPLWFKVIIWVLGIAAVTFIALCTSLYIEYAAAAFVIFIFIDRR